MSLDGCIADENGSVDWLDGDGSEPDAAGSYADFIQDIDTVIMGRRTYDQVTGTLSPNNWPYDGRQTYVITHQLLPDQPGITFTSEAPATLVRRLQAEKGRGIWILGGAHIAQALLAEGFIDRLQITIIPTLLGGGVRLLLGLAVLHAPDDQQQCHQHHYQYHQNGQGFLLLAVHTGVPPITACAGASSAQSRRSAARRG